MRIWDYPQHTHIHKHMLVCVSAISWADISRDHYEPSGMWRKEQCKWLHNDFTGPVTKAPWTTNGHLDKT